MSSSASRPCQRCGICPDRRPRSSGSCRRRSWPSASSSPATARSSSSGSGGGIYAWYPADAAARNQSQLVDVLPALGEERLDAVVDVVLGVHAAGDHVLDVVE